MKVELIEQKCYSLKVGDVRLDGLMVSSEWNGLTELRDGKGNQLIVLITNCGGLAGGLSQAMSQALGLDAPIAATVVTCSPDLISVLRG